MITDIKMMMLTEAVDASIRQKAHGSVALVTGCFDVLHMGHIDLINNASLKGAVFVGVNSDESVAALKPGRPINNLKDRMRFVAALEVVDAVFPIAKLDDNNGVEFAIRTIKPNYWVKGGDYTMDTLNPLEVKACMDVGTEVVIVPQKYDISTSLILAKLND